MVASRDESGTLERPAAGEGDRSVGPGAGSFDAAWARVRPQVAAFCWRAARNAADAEELYQVIAIRAWRGHQAFRGESAYLTWAMRIAEREAIRMAARRDRIIRHEVATDPLAAGDWLTAQAAGPAEAASWVVPGAEPGWIGTAVRQAERLGVLGDAEARVLAERLADRDASWQGIGARLGLTATACAVAHCRAVPKLRVFLFTHHQEALGGRTAIAAAFRRAQAGASPLTGAEAEAFSFIVLDRRADYRRRGWQAALRGACAKVAPHLAAGASG
jgi:DNA-directed RNA polymerase specialized sigma24 family protein